METAWFICPYDVRVEHGRKLRVCAMNRHIPALPNAAGDLWDELEILNGQALVKVWGTPSAMSRIRADPDFVELPSSGSVPSTIRDRLLLAGYAPTELVAGTIEALRMRISVVRSALALNVQGDIIMSGRVPTGKTVAEVDRKVPG